MSRRHVEEQRADEFSITLYLNVFFLYLSLTLYHSLLFYCSVDLACTM